MYSKIPHILLLCKKQSCTIWSFFFCGSKIVYYGNWTIFVLPCTYKSRVIARNDEKNSRLMNSFQVTMWLQKPPTVSSNNKTSKSVTPWLYLYFNCQQISNPSTMVWSYDCRILDITYSTAEKYGRHQGSQRIPSTWYHLMNWL